MEDHLRSLARVSLCSMLARLCYIPFNCLPLFLFLPTLRRLLLTLQGTPVLYCAAATEEH